MTSQDPIQPTKRDPNGRPVGSLPELEPLPSDVDASLRELDGRIRREIAEPALRTGVPAGLEDRVFEASAGLLSRAAGLTRRGPRRERPGTARPAHPVVGRIGFFEQTWARMGGRLAMAASLGLVFVVAAFFMARPDDLPGGPTAGPEIALASDLSWLGSEAFKEEPQVAYLLDTGDLQSFDELAMELESAIDEFEM